MNNIRVYTCMSGRYSPYFGFTEEEAGALLSFYGLELNEQVRKKYDGYRIGYMHLHNPWSLLIGLAHYGKESGMAYERIIYEP